MLYIILSLPFFLPSPCVPNLLLLSCYYSRYAMGIPIDSNVQEGDANGYAAVEKVPARETKASGSTHSLDRNVRQHHSEKAPLEDILAYADAQYYNNAIVPEGDSYSPREAILKGPLKHVWGPATPHMNALPASEKVLALSEGDVEGNGDLNDAMAKDLHSRRMLRKVTALGAFYLITTDIMGPFNTGYVFSQVGYVPGALCYFFLGIAAWYAGNLLSVMYMRVDSDRYPVKSFGGIVLRVLGPYARVFSDVLMIIQVCQRRRNTDNR